MRPSKLLPIVFGVMTLTAVDAGATGQRPALKAKIRSVFARAPTRASVVHLAESVAYGLDRLHRLVFGKGLPAPKPKQAAPIAKAGAKPPAPSVLKRVGRWMGRLSERLGSREELFDRWASGVLGFAESFAEKLGPKSPAPAVHAISPKGR